MSTDDEVTQLRGALALVDAERADLAQQLDRLQAQHDIMENVLFGAEREHEKARQEIEATQVELRQSYENLTRLKAQQDEMLATLNDGLLDIGPGGIVGPNHSRSALRLLGRDVIAGARFADLFNETPELAAQIAEFVDIAMTSEFASDDMIASISPLREITLTAGDTRRTLSARVNRFVSDSERHLLVVISDRTAEVKLAAELRERTRERQVFIERAHKILMTPASVVRDVAREGMTFVKELSHYGDGTRRDELRLRAHAIKGDARAIGLDAVASTMEKLEQLLSDNAPLRAVLDTANTLDAELQTDLSLLDRLSAMRDTEGAVATSDPIESVLAACAKREAEATGTEASVAWTSELPRTVNEEMFETLRSALVALVRNAVAHGASTERALAIEVSAARRDADVVVRVRDNGKGVDWEGVRHRAVERGLVSAGEAATFTQDDLGELLFASGMSTREHIDGSAGRGLGLEIVRQITRQLGGLVRLKSERGVFTEVALEIPWGAMRGAENTDARRFA